MERDHQPFISRTQAFLHLVGLSCFAIAHPLIDKLSDNVEFFIARKSERIDILLLVVFVYLIAPILLWIIEESFGLLERTIRNFSIYTLVASLAFITLVPVARGVGNFSGLIAILVGGILAIAFTLLYIRSKVAREFLSVLSIFSVISALSFIFNSSVTQILFPKALPQIQTQEKGRAKIESIVLVVFDEFPLSSLLDEKQEIDGIRFPHFGALARESHWFRNATAVSTHTTLAVPAILTGRYPSESRKVPSAEVHPYNIFSVLRGSYQLNVDERITRLCPPGICKKYAKIPPLLHRMDALLWDLTAVYLHTIVPTDIDIGLPDIGTNWGNFWSGTEKRISKKDAKHEARMVLFERFLSNLSPGKGPTFHFTHDLFPHMPYQFMPSGRTYPFHEVPRGYKNEAWIDDEYAKEQAYQQFLLMVQTTDGLLGRIVQKLKDSGIYDKTLLVVTADHGATFGTGQHRRGTYDTATDYYEDILSVPLFMKLPEEKTGIIEDRNVEAIDIFPTIAKLAGLDLKEKVDGYSALDTDLPIRQKKKLVFGKKTKQAKIMEKDRSYEMVEFDSPILPPRRTLDWKLEHFGTGSTKPNGIFEIGPKRNIVGTKIDPVKLPTYDGCSVELNDTVGVQWREGYADIDPKAKKIPAHILGTLICKGETHPMELAALLNGEVVSTTYSYLKENGGSVGFEFLIPEAFFKPGRAVLEFLAIDDPNSALPSKILRNNS